MDSERLLSGDPCLDTHLSSKNRVEEEGVFFNKFEELGAVRLNGNLNPLSSAIRSGLGGRSKQRPPISTASGSCLIPRC